MFIIGIVLYYLIAFTHAEETHPSVITSLGAIRGYYKTSYNGRVYAAFEGIPYAKPPLGDLRFREPVDIEPWEETWTATKIHACIQLPIMFLNNVVTGEEDCLYLNVYVPKENPTTKDNYDVVVHIHGGAFMVGNPAMAIPTYLMDQNIVYVSLNYRLGIMGFLSTEDEVVPGNNGMKDQVLALRWVQQHIRQFGGNPKSVTLVGVSAGGAATHLHYFSKLSKGLFHRGISHSGTALAPWAIQQGALERAQFMATVLGCTISSNIEMIECLRKKPAKQVVEKITALQAAGPMLPLAPFAPVIEKSHKGAFIDDHPYNLLKNGKLHDLPWIGTVTKDEGFLGLMTLGQDINNIDIKWNDVAPYLLNYYNSSCESNLKSISKKVKEFYFQKNLISSNIKNLMNLCGDRLFTHSLEKSSNMQSKVLKSSVYTYIYSYNVDAKSIFAELFNLNDDDIVNHAEDSMLMYEFSLGDLKSNATLSKEDVAMKDWFMNLYATFASGNDISMLAKNKWTPSDSSSKNFNYLHIRNPKDIKMDTKIDTNSIEFWDSLLLMENQIRPKSACEESVNQQKSEL